MLHTFVFTRVLGLTIDRARYGDLAVGLAVLFATAYPASVGSWPYYAVAVAVFVAYLGYVVQRNIGIGRAGTMLRRVLPKSA